MARKVIGPTGSRRRRWLFLLCLGSAISAAVISIPSALAVVNDTGTYDLTVPNKNTSTGLVSLGAGSAEYIGSSANNQASGTGLFDPFVRLQGSPTEQGFNTNAPVTFDAKTGTWTHAIKVNAIPIVDCDGSGPGTATCWELFNDINESNSTKRISLNDVQIWFTNSATTTDGTGTTFTSFASPATLEYHFSGDILINDVNQGSGRGDLRYLVPTAGHTWDSSTYFVLYSQWGTTTGTAGNYGTGGYSSDGGFEEWKVRKTPTVSIVKTANPAGPVNAGDNIGFDITVSNTGAADATNVSISDTLPAGQGTDLNWSLNPAFTGCSISGSTGSQSLACSLGTLAAGGSIGPIHLTSSTTAADCATVDNTATVTFDGGTASDGASVVVNCGALLIRKESTKTLNPLVSTSGASFCYSTSSGCTATSVIDESTNDELTGTGNVGLVCVSGLAPGTYYVNETGAPTGYGASTSGEQTATVVNGTDCSSNLPTLANTAVFTDPPLADVQINFRDEGSGETSLNVPMTCTASNSTGTDAASTPPTDWQSSDTITGVEAGSSTVTVTCTAEIDP